MSLGSENFDLVTGFPGSDGIDIPTPIDQATSYPSFGNELRTPSGVPIKATPASQFGPFCRTVKSTQVLGRIQQYASRIRGKPFSEEDHMEGKELHELVQSQLSELLRLATSGWEESCSGIGITVA